MLDAWLRSIARRLAGRLTQRVRRSARLARWWAPPPGAPEQVRGAAAAPFVPDAPPESQFTSTVAVEAPPIEVQAAPTADPDTLRFWITPGPAAPEAVRAALAGLDGVAEARVDGDGWLVQKRAERSWFQVGPAVEAVILVAGPGA